MKRNLFLAILAGGLISFVVSDVQADTPFSFGRHRRVGRIEGFWCQPTKGPLFDYSPYFAARYPQLPGALEFQWPPSADTPHGNGIVTRPIGDAPNQAAPANPAPSAPPAPPKP